MQTRKYCTQPPLTLATFGSIFSEFSTDINSNCCSVLYSLGLRVEGLNCVCYRVFCRVGHLSKTETATTDRVALLPGIVEQRKSSRPSSDVVLLPCRT